jgi:MATE family multidrug resistance protein
MSNSPVAKPPPQDSLAMGLGTHISKTIKLAWPVILGQIGHILIGNADTIMIGQLGSTSLAAATLANAVFFLPIVIGIGVCVAISPITAQAVGAGKMEGHLRDVLHQGVLFAIYLSAVLMLAVFGIGELFPYLGQDPEVAAASVGYMRILAISTFPFMIFLIYKHFIEGFESMVPGMVVMGAVVVINILLNWLLIYGHWGFPELGLNGAGWATLIARIAGMTGIMLYVHLGKRFRPYNYFRQFFKHKRIQMMEIARIGLPSGMMYFFEIGAFTGAVVLAGQIGKEAQSAHQIAIQTIALFFMFYVGIAQAAGIRVGNAVGRVDLSGVRKAGIAGLATGIACVVVFVSLMVALRHVIPAWYIQDAAVIDIAVPLLLIGAIFQLFDGIQAISAGILRGMSDVKIPTAITFVAYWVIGLPAAWVLSGPLGMATPGIWWGLTIGLGFSALLMSVRFLVLSGRG